MASGCHESWPALRTTGFWWTSHQKVETMARCRWKPAKRWATPPTWAIGGLIPMDSVSLRRTTSYYVAVPCCSQSSRISAAVGGHGPLSYRRGRAMFSPDIGLESKCKKNKVKNSVIMYDLLRFFLEISVRLSNIFFFGDHSIRPLEITTVLPSKRFLF